MNAMENNKGVKSEIQDFKLKDCTIQLYESPELFMPNATTRLFSKATEIRPGDVVFDIGSGVGPLAIWAAKKPSKRVYAVEIILEQCELLKMNAELNEVGDKIEIYNGSLLEPIPPGILADVLIADVSGIAERPGRMFGWYPSSIPTGGTDGTETTVQLLEQAGTYMAEGGRLYFPVAVGLADEEKIMEVARANFGRLEEKVNVDFPLSKEEGEGLLEGAEPFIHLRRRRNPNPARAFTWRGNIYEATEPVRRG